MSTTCCISINNPFYQRLIDYLEKNHVGDIKEYHMLQTGIMSPRIGTYTVDNDLLFELYISNITLSTDKPVDDPVFAVKIIGDVKKIKLFIDKINMTSQHISYFWYNLSSFVPFTIQELKKIDAQHVYAPMKKLQHIMDDINNILNKKQWFDNNHIKFRRVYHFIGSDPDLMFDVVHFIASELNMPLHDETYMRYQGYDTGPFSTCGIKLRTYKPGIDYTKFPVRDEITIYTGEDQLKLHELPDCIVNFDCLDDECTRRMLLNIHPQLTNVDDFVQSIVDLKVNQSMLKKQLIIFNEIDLTKIIENIKEIKELERLKNEI